MKRLKPLLAAAFALFATLLVTTPQAHAHVELNHPSGDEVFVVGDSVTIEWTEVINHNTSQWTLEFSRDGGENWIKIADVEYAKRSYKWRVPDLAKDEAVLRVTQVNPNTTNYTDVSDTFRVLESAPTPPDSMFVAMKAPGGQTVLQDTVAEGDSLMMSNLNFPLSVWNGSRLHIPDSAFTSNITLDITLPEIASVDLQQQTVQFGDQIATAISFSVYQGDTLREPYVFQAPVHFTMKIPDTLPDSLDDSFKDLQMAYYSDVAGFDTTGIETIRRDSAEGLITARLSHFSTVTVTRDGATGTSVTETDPQTPQTIRLRDNYPNPFNPTTTIPFSLSHSTHIRLTVYNILGQHVATLLERQLPAGRHTAIFNANGQSSGIYLYKLETPTVIRSKKMMMLK